MNWIVADKIMNKIAMSWKNKFIEELYPVQKYQ